MYMYINIYWFAFYRKTYFHYYNNYTKNNKFNLFSLLWIHVHVRMIHALKSKSTYTSIVRDL